MSQNYDVKKQLEALKSLAAYELKEITEIPEIKATGVVMEHVKTEARVFLLLSEDNNKVFTIGFRTPSLDSTGAAHIVEHTTLCGSAKYPSKDPFVELVKGSLNTFLNAMTYPDKTIYPAASCNETDFGNLMDVYLDAVFHPNFYSEEKIFRQEGWHYEAKSVDGPLTLSGVVYNEMKGVYSAPDGVMDRAIGEALFPGHSYSEESGGDPDCIPDLTYQQYLDFHGMYYHPSNAFIYLYGNTDMAARLDYIDREYLSAYEKAEMDTSIPLPEPLGAPVEKVVEYALSNSESEENTWFYSLSKRIDCELDPLRLNALQTLQYVLLEMPGAPLKEALVEAGIGEDVYGEFSDGIRLPYFSIVAKNAGEGQKDSFLSVIRDTLTSIVEEGLDKDTLLAAINVEEFRVREADFGPYPKGLMYGIECFHSWLYDEDPCMHLRFEEMFRELKEKVNEGFFEALIRELILENREEAVIIMKPVKGLAEKKAEILAEKMKAVQQSLGTEGMEKVIREAKELKAYQNEPSSPEDLKKIPLLKRSDIRREAGMPVFTEKETEGLPTIRSEINTSGIAYLRMLFDVKSLSTEELSAAAFLRDLFGFVDTEKHSYAELSTLVNLESGGIGFGMDCYSDAADPGKTYPVFHAGSKVFYHKIGFALQTIHEMLCETKLDDPDRIREVLSEVRAEVKDRLTSAGHSAAMNRAASFLTEEDAFSDITRGIAYYRFIDRYASDYEALAGELKEILSRVIGKIFTADNLRIHICAEAEGMSAFEEAVKDYRSIWPATAERSSAQSFAPKAEKEALMTASMVNYVGRAGNFRAHGYEYTGALKVLKLLLSYDYLWNRIRVDGNAYGCMAAFRRNGSAGFVSYRDPKITETNAVYDGIADYAANYDADEREMTKAVIGTMGEVDMPLTPQTKGLRGLAAYYTHVTKEQLQRERDQVLDVQPEDIRALAPLLKAVLSDNAVCVIGSEAQIRKECGDFDTVTSLAGKSTAEETEEE